MTTRVATLDLDCFEVSAAHGFLSDREPLASFGSDAEPWLQSLDEVGHALSTLQETDQLRPRLRDLAVPPSGLFDDLSTHELRRVYSVAGFLANAYVHKIDAPSDRTLPAGVAVPLYESTSRLGCTPALSYDAYVLYNWTRIDPEGETTPHNLRPVTNFVDLRDERWFVAIHAAIESAAGPALAAIGTAQQGIVDDDPERVHRSLRTIEDALHDTVTALGRMGEHNAPEQYGQGFRPYLGALTDVEYQGVAELEGPQSFRGASGAQSSLFPALDAAFGIDHGDNPLVTHLRSLRQDMPPTHRAFVQAARNEPDVRDYVVKAGGPLREAYNECIELMTTFREDHQRVVERFVANQLGDTTGTGGTPYKRFLEMFTENTQKSRVPETA